MFTVPQIVLIILWFTLYNVITSATGFGLVAGGVVLNGLATGLIMGDVATGFYLGGTYELMNIGLNPLGGSTVPNYNMGVVVGVAFGAVTNMETGMAVGIVVATLASTLDVLAKMSGSFFLHKAQECARAKDVDTAVRWIHIGLWPRILLTAPLPLLILFVAGAPIVEAVNNFIPAWLLAGFKNAGNRLCNPAALHEHQGELPVCDYRFRAVRVLWNRSAGRGPDRHRAGNDRVLHQQ